MYRIRKLEVRRFRGLAGPVTLEFGDRYNLIIGENGSGKTNLLRLLAMVTRMDFSPLAEESFEFAWEGVEDDGSSFRGEVRREVSREAGTVAWAWRLAFDAAGYPPQHRSSSGEGEIGQGADPARHGGIGSWLGGGHQARLRRYRSALADSTLATFQALTTASRDDKDPALEPFLAAIITIHGTRSGMALGADPPDEWVEAGEGAALDASSLPWLDHARRELGAGRIILTPRLASHRKFTDQEICTVFLGCDIHVGPADAAVHHDRLSFGEQRLIGLRWYLCTTPEAPAIIDELSNGLHHAWVESIVRDLEDKQSFLATQSPVVMDAVWWESAEEAGRGIVICTRDSEHRWVWRQLDERERVRLFEALRAGVQQTHEVLQTEGWW